jgi:hypothetical protein
MSDHFLSKLYDMTHEVNSSVIRQTLNILYIFEDGFSTHHASYWIEIYY